MHATMKENFVIFYFSLFCSNKMFIANKIIKMLLNNAERKKIKKKTHVNKR